MEVCGVDIDFTKSNGFFLNADCMDGMKQFPDKYFDLAIVDPPYGIGWDKQAEAKGGTQYGKSKARAKTYHTTGWDNQRTTKAYFDELERVSKAQIIWGGNYFSDMLRPSKCFIAWDKKIIEAASNDFADCELAYCSENLGVARMFRFMWNGMLQGNMKNKEVRIHPTQKPVELYLWILTQYAKPGDKILDTHAGSASSLVACHRLGFQYVGFELDEVYFNLARDRLEREKAQISLFD